MKEYEWLPTLVLLEKISMSIEKDRTVNMRLMYETIGRLFFDDVKDLSFIDAFELEDSDLERINELEFDSFSIGCHLDLDEDFIDDDHTSTICDLVKIIIVFEIYGNHVMALNAKKTLSKIIADSAYHAKCNQFDNESHDAYKNAPETVTYKSISEFTSEIARRPRNPLHDEAIKIIKDTWLSYPTASKTSLCKAVNEHFSNKVSIKTLERWIDKYGLMPEKPQKYSSFTLIVNE